MKKPDNKSAPTLIKYNNERLSSMIGNIAPKDKLKGRKEQIFKERNRKLEAARETRKLKRRGEKIQPPNGQNNKKKVLSTH